MCTNNITVLHTQCINISVRFKLRKHYNTIKILYSVCRCNIRLSVYKYLLLLRIRHAPRPCSFCPVVYVRVKIYIRLRVNPYVEHTTWCPFRLWTSDNNPADYKIHQIRWNKIDIYLSETQLWRGVFGGAVGWGTALQFGRVRVRYPTHLIVCNNRDRALERKAILWNILRNITRVSYGTKW